MTKITIEVSEDEHIQLLEIQLERKKQKKEPSAINKIASEIFVKALVNKKAAK